MTVDRLPRDPGTFIRGADAVVPARLAGPLLRFLLPVLRDQVAASGWTLVIPGEIAGFLEALSAVDVARERGVSEFGNPEGLPATLVDMRTPDDAGAEVGLSGSRVRQLRRAGLVACRPSGARGYLVDVESLRTYLRGRGAVA